MQENDTNEHTQEQDLLLHRKKMEYARKQRKKKQRFQLALLIAGLLIIVIIIIIVFLKEDDKKTGSKKKTEVTEYKYIDVRPELDVQLLDVNKYSRPGIAMEEVNAIVIHYTANPGTTAQQNRNYFQNLSTSKTTYASSHFIIGLEGEIIQCIPCNEIAYASNDRNYDTIAIECCIKDETGEFNSQTYSSLVWLTAWLMGRYSLSSEDVIRHYDITGKNCPKYFVENETKWDEFKQDLLKFIDENGIDKPKETDDIIKEQPFENNL